MGILLKAFARHTTTVSGVSRRAGQRLLTLAGVFRLKKVDGWAAEAGGWVAEAGGWATKASGWVAETETGGWATEANSWAAETTASVRMPSGRSYQRPS